MPRIAIVTNFIPAYRYPVFKRISDSTTDSEYYFLTSSPIAASCDEARQNLWLRHTRTLHIWNKTHHGEGRGAQREEMPIPVGLFVDLLLLRPDVIISGDFGLRSLICWVAARLLRAKFVVWSEEIASSARGRSLVQKIMRRFIAHHADACLAWGLPASEYLQRLGVDKNKVFRCAQAIDNESWIKYSATIDREQARHELRVSGTVFLFVGRLVERKGVTEFIHAWSNACKATSAPMTAIIVGDGEQEAELKRLVLDNHLDNVRFVDRQVAFDLARYYTAADIFVFPSLEDVWGLVVNEAMCFGLPVLASKYAGASQELIANSELGIVFDPGNVKEFTDQLCKLAVSPPPIDLKSCHQRLKAVTFDHSSDAISQLLDYLGKQTDRESKSSMKSQSLRPRDRIVTIIQQVVPHYRVAFFRQLHARLQQDGITLRLLYGDKNRGPADTAQIINEDWAQEINTVKYNVTGIELIWQSALPSLKNSELVIVEQSNRLLINYILQIRRLWSSRKLAYWGHGRNMQATDQSIFSERIKVMLLPRVDWWFAYTDMTRDYVVSKKFAADRITVVNNAVADNVTPHMRQWASMSRTEVCHQLGLAGDNVALFCGGLYKQKRIEFLLSSAERIRSLIPDFELLIVGEGPEKSLIEQAAARHDWIHYAGAMHGAAIARYWYAAKILLMPGVVGLVVVDSFNAGCPMLTTTYPYHSPEIAYLQSGFNGIQTDDNVESFSNVAAALLNDHAAMETLRQGCLLSAKIYTLDNMVEKFARGIEKCLQ